MIAAYPGSFDPPTVAHLAVAEAAVRQAGLVRVDLVLSRRPLGKELRGPSVDQRAEVLHRVAADRPWLGVAVVDHRLVADIAEGYDAVVMGADKWAQVVDPAWYGGSVAARDTAVARLPRTLVAPRGQHPAAVAAAAGLAVAVAVAVEALGLPPGLDGVSSTLARSGHHHVILSEAVASGLWTATPEAPGPPPPSAGGQAVGSS